MQRNTGHRFGQADTCTKVQWFARWVPVFREMEPARLAAQRPRLPFRANIPRDPKNLSAPISRSDIIRP
jgi:hypothetical protein